MTPPAQPRLGVTYVPALPPERLREIAFAAESSGLDEFWIWEDCFKESGIATAAATLAWTERIRVGIGLLPTPLRNVALTAMEIATLDRLFPGRFVAGVGHGVQSWMAQVGARAESPLTLLTEYGEALRKLLAGESVTTSGRYVRLDDVRLDWPPTSAPPLLFGGQGPKTLALAARLGDGTLLSSPLSEEEVGRAGALIAQSRLDLDGPPVSDRPHEVVSNLIAATGPGASEWVDAELVRWQRQPEQGLGAAGDAAQIAAAIRRLAALGATSVSIQPTEDEPDLIGLIRFLGAEVRPLLT